MKVESNTKVNVPRSWTWQIKPSNLHTSRRVLQDQETTRAVKAEVLMGVRTVVKVRPNSCSHKLCSNEKGGYNSDNKCYSVGMQLFIYQPFGSRHH